MTRVPACIVCGAEVVAADREYSVEEIFHLWEPIRFLRATIDEHTRQAQATRLYRCTNCGLERFYPPVIGTPAFYVESYNLQHTQGASTFGYSDDKWDFDQALGDAAACRQIFEFGCGVGNFLVRAKDRGLRVAGMEYNAEALVKARAKGLEVVPSVDDTARFRGTCDAAFAFHVLEHVPDPVAFVRAMMAVTKPGGLIGLSVPDQDGPIRFIRPCVMNMPPHHATRWRLSAFKALAHEVGLVIRRVAYEPLLLANHGYYSVHWAKNRFVSYTLRLLLGGLRRLGFEYFPLLRGQSIYVLMSPSTT